MHLILLWCTVIQLSTLHYTDENDDAFVVPLMIQMLHYFVRYTENANVVAGIYVLALKVFKWNFVRA